MIGRTAFLVMALVAAMTVDAATARKYSSASLEFRKLANNAKIRKFLAQLELGHARIRLIRADYEVRLNRRLAATGASALFDLMTAENDWLRADVLVKRAKTQIKENESEAVFLTKRAEELEEGHEDIVGYAKGMVELRKLHYDLAVQLAENARPFAQLVSEKARRGKMLLRSHAISHEEWHALALAAEEAKGLSRLADQAVIDTRSYVAEAEREAAEVQEQVRRSGTPRRSDVSARAPRP